MPEAYIQVENASREEVEKCVEAIRHSNVLGGSDRLDQLLHYLVEEELSGRGDRLKAYSIALDVYDKDEDFNPATNSIVRVEMHRLRKALELFDATCDSSSGLRLSFDKGSYRPIFMRPVVSEDIEPQGQKWSVSGSWNPRLMLGIAASILAVMLSVYAILNSTTGKQCQRPGLTFQVSRSNEIPSSYVEATMTEIIQSYPLISQLRGSEFCTATPQFVLRVTPISAGGNSSIQATLSLPDMDNKTIWLRSYPVINPKNQIDVRLALAKIGHNLFSPDGVIPNRSMNMDWRDENAREEYQCLLGVHRYWTLATDNGFDKNFECLREKVKKGSQFSDVYAHYALMVQMNILGYASYNIPDAKREYNTNINTAFAIDPLDGAALTGRLREYRNEVPPNYDRLDMVLRIVDQNFRDHPDMLYQFSMVEGLIFGNWDSSQEKINWAIAITGDKPQYQYPLVANYMVRDQWELAHERMKITQSTMRALDCILLITVGEKMNDEQMVGIGVKCLKRMKLYSYEKVMEHLSRRNYHSSFMQHLEFGTKSHFNNIALKQAAPL